MSKLTTFAAALTLIFTSSVFGASESGASSNAGPNNSTNSIYELNVIQEIQNHPDLSMFTMALQTVDLLTILQGSGPYTLLAPTNDAFSKMPAGELQELLKPENKDKLKSILLHHVLAEKVDLAKTKTMKIKTMDGKEINLAVNGDSIKINNANAAKSAIVGSNGVIYMVDAVLTP